MSGRTRQDRIKNECFRLVLWAGSVSWWSYGWLVIVSFASDRMSKINR